MGEISFRDWFAEAEAAAHVATQLADTPFVPDTLKRWRAVNGHKMLDLDGTVAVVTAALLTGQELGFGPMASLRSIDIIRGTPALRAMALRALVQKFGHDITVVESTATRAVVRGRRSNGETQQSVWTLDRARALGVYPGPADGQWQRQPQSMLVARASAEIARWIASDAILGMPYAAEELADEPNEVYAGEAPGEAPPAKPPPRTAKRKTRVNGAADKPPLALAPPPPPAPEPVAGSHGPPAPPVDAEGEAVPYPAEPAAEDEPPPPVSRKQLIAIHARLREAGITDPAEGLRRIGEWIGRPITTTKQLSEADAGTVLDRLGDAAAERGPEEAPDADQ
jgi:hypothetical protein